MAEFILMIRVLSLVSLEEFILPAVSKTSYARFLSILENLHFRYNKFYNVSWNGGKKIMCNDNSSYYKDYLGYPGIAFLMAVGKIPHDKELANSLKGIPWKDMNVEF